MTTPLVILEGAEEDLQGAIKWYEDQRIGLGLLGEADRIFPSIERNPARFPLWDGADGTRRALLGRFPYAVFFTERPDAIEIVALAHLRRKAGYWHGRSSYR